MAAIYRFEDLECWRMARTLCQLVYEATGQGVFVKDYSLKDQINRSSGSTMDNIAEGFERGVGATKNLSSFCLFLKHNAKTKRIQLRSAVLHEQFV